MNKGVSRRPDIRDTSAHLWCIIASILIQNDGCKCKARALEKTGMFLPMILVDIVCRLPVLTMQLFQILFSSSARWMMFSDE